MPSRYVTHVERHISKLLNQVVDWAVIQGNEHKIIEQMQQHKIPFT